MAKILFTQNNSQWGIITNPVAGNVFRHTIDFPDATDEASFITLRNQFINEQLFDTVETFQELFTSIKDQAFTRLNETQIEFNFALDSDPLSRNFKEIMNSDYMILEYLIGEVKHYEFYAIIPQDRAGTDSGVFVFKGELDIFLSFYITYRNQNQIKRMHTDRHDGTNYLIENNTVIESDLEAIEPSFKSKEKIKWNYTDEEVVNDNTNWLIIYEKIESDVQGTILVDSYKDLYVKEPNRLPYNIYVVPLMKRDTSTTSLKIKYSYTNGGSDFDLSNETYKYFRDKATTIAIHYLNVPFWELGKYFTMNVTVDDLFIRQYHVRFQQGIDFVEYFEYNAMSNSFKMLSVDRFRFNSISESVIIYSKPTSTTHLQPREILNETKLQFSQFTKYFITNRRSEKGELRLEFKERDTFTSTYAFQPDKYTNLIYTDELGSFNSFEKYGAITTDIIELPLATDPWDEYVTNNRVTSKTSLLVPSVGIGIGVVGKLRPSQQSPALFLGAGKLLSNLSAKGDIKNQPLTPKEVSNSYQIDWLSLDDFNYVEKVELEPNYINIVFDYLYKLGYEVNILKNIDDIKISRYYFNHIEALDVFSNINGKLSSVIKQLIDESFKNGITFWHYRDESTWKGINSYTLENQEMNLVLIKSTKKVQDENPNK